MIIKIYTDGSCIGNPGIGGWAAIILEDKIEKKISGNKIDTTNNQMELTAAIKSLEYYESRKKIIIFTDSTYVKDGITKWIKNWKVNNWKTASKQNVKNKELWEKLDTLAKFHDVQWKWIKAHAKNFYNNMADELARETAKKN